MSHESPAETIPRRTPDTSHRRDTDTSHRRDTDTSHRRDTDTSHRLYATVVFLVVFLVMWAAVAARPWATAKPDPRLAALAQREQRLRTDARVVDQVVAQRLSAYRVALKQRQELIAQARTRSLQSNQTAAAPSTTASVRIVNLPPLTITRSS